MCLSTGGHYNPAGHKHASRNSKVRHVGDLGNVKADRSGAADIKFEDPLDLSGPHSIIGRACVLHAGEDDLGRGGTKGSLASGSAGPRIACGIIGLVDEHW